MSGAFPTPEEIAADGFLGAKMILEERLRQIREEGWDADNDDSYRGGELIRAAQAYLMMSSALIRLGPEIPFRATVAGSDWWPWDERSYNPKADVKKNLVWAGALIAAELDRMERNEQHVAISTKGEK